MNTNKSQQARYDLPLLMRLIDEAPEKSFDENYSPLISAEQLYEAIRNNLERLLNYRCKNITWPAECKELNASIVNYGIADFSHGTFNQSEMQSELCKQITAAIEHFEPRLQRIEVSIINESELSDRVLKLRIEAMINLKPLAKAAVFESNLEMSRRQFTFE